MTTEQRKFVVGKPHVVALFDGTHFQFFDHERKSVTDLGRVNIPNSPSRRLDTQSEILIRQIADSRKPVVMRLSEDMGLVCFDRFPESARQDLKAIVAHRIDSLTPWSADKVLFDARVAGKLGNGQIDAMIIAALREQVDLGLEGLGALGLTAAAADLVVDFPNAPCTLNLLGSTESVQGVGISGWLAGAAATVAMAVIGFCYFDISSRAQVIEDRITLTEGVQERVADLPDLLRRLDALKHQTDIIADRRRGQPSILLVIEDLSDALPDGVWLRRLAIAEDQLAISGYAPDAEVLLALIESESAFGAAEFTAPSRRELVLVDGLDHAADSFALKAIIESLGTRLPTVGGQVE